MINDVLSVQSIYKKEYDELVDCGRKYIKDKKIAVVGLCRNIETIIDKNIQKIVNLLKDNCNEYKIILFENDSIDNTKLKIENWIKTNNNIILISKNLNRPQYGSVKDNNRTTYLAEYRNLLKEYLYKNYHDYDLVIVIDTDFQDFSEDGILNTFGWFSVNENIDAMCGNSFQIKNIFSESKSSLWNYDSWAFRFTWWNDWQTVPESKFYNYNPMFWFGLWILPPGSKPIKINSGFGGCCIYKLQKYLTGKYDGFDCEHVCFHYDLKDKNENFNLFLNPSQIMLLYEQ